MRVDEEKEWLGEGGEGQFDFAQMQDIGTNVDVLSGNVVRWKGTGRCGCLVGLDR